MKREKRAEKAIESFKEQIELHKKKQEAALEGGNEELYEYYDKEMKKFEKELDKKKRILDK